MKVIFESNYQSKILNMQFEPSSQISSNKDVLAWRSQWTQALTSWHSPYKALVDCTNLNISSKAQEEELTKSLDLMMSFFKGLFLKKVSGFGYKSSQGHDLLPFKVHETQEEAQKELGIREKRNSKFDDFRSTIQFDNHFKQHVVELSFSSPIKLDNAEKIQVLKSKLMNNLMLWHSSWSLIVDCSNLEIEAEIHPLFEGLARSLKGFFLKNIVGYAPKASKHSYPFKGYRARHRAAAELESEGNFSGEDANCSSRKV